MHTLRLVLLLTLGLTAGLHAENWPQWRGPAASGVSPEKGLPSRWSETENVAWKARIRGLGISSPIVWGDRVFVTSQIGSGDSRPGPMLVQSGDPSAVGERALGSGRSAGAAASGSRGVAFLVTAFDRASGRQLWEYQLAAEGQLPGVHEKHNLASSSPVTDGERVYAWFGTGQIAALDMSGKLVWKRNLGAEYSPFEIDWGHGSSPVVFRDSVVLLCYHEPAAYLLSLDSRTGNVRWKVNGGKGDFSYSTPLVIDTAGSAELVVNTSAGLRGHDAASGRLLWQIDETSRFPIPVPLHHEGTIYTSRGYRSGPYMAIRTGGKGNVERTHVQWRIDTGAPYISSLVHYEGMLYMAGDVGVMSAIDAKTGQRTWQERVGGVYTASPVAADGKIYMLGESGETVVLAAGRTPRVLARNKLDARQLASPAISGGRLFIRSDEFLYAIGK